MSRIIKRRPSPAMIVAIIACVLAAAGTSWAAGLHLNIFSKGAKVNTFGVGPLIYSSSNQFLPPGTTRTLTVSCPHNTRAVGGGIRSSTGVQIIQNIIDSYPTNFGWAGHIDNFGGESHTAVITAVCARTLKAKGTIAGLRVK